MEKWKTRVKFRDLLEDYDTDADEINEIKRVIPLWKERFNSIPLLKQFSNDLDKVKTESQFNKWLNRVYDFCDFNRIWIEL